MAWKWKIAGPYIQYAKTVIPLLGEEKVFGLMRGHWLDIDRSMRFLVDVLGDLKEGGLAASEFEGAFEGMKIIAEIKPPFDRDLFARFGELLQNPEISARYEFPRRQELVELVFKCLEPAPE
jgi:hypothetical protein